MDDLHKTAKEVFYPNTIQFQAGVKKVSTMADHTLDVILNTQELPEDQMTQLFKLKKNHCAVCIAPYGEEIAPFDPVTIDAPKGKSPGQRLRAVLYKNWQQNDEGIKDSDQHYITKMNQIIEHYKAKLN